MDLDTDKRGRMTETPTDRMIARYSTAIPPAPLEHTLEPRSQCKLDRVMASQARMTADT